MVVGLMPVAHLTKSDHTNLNLLLPKTVGPQMTERESGEGKRQEDPQVQNEGLRLPSEG